MSTQAITPARLPQQIFNSPIVDQQGYVTQVWRKLFQTLPFNAQSQQLVKGTHASRKNILASGYVDGSVFDETDRGVLYAAISGSWIYFAGVMLSVQASLPDATDLGKSDTGLLCLVTDFNHVLEWNGTSWQWAPGELGSDMIVAFLSGPSQPVGWQLCDGTQGVASLQSDGTLLSVNLPTIVGSFYRQ
jgi:hypothetical protein